ncbi:MAG: putative DNA polymerase delta catalytic subunit, partial [Streblomastix strix]
SLSPSDYTRTPTGNYFIHKGSDGSREGILPEILKGVLAARKRAKDELKLEKDPFNQAVLNGRQLALKIVANSVYGFTGAQVGKLPCLEISQSVTAIGREMIDRTKNYVEERYTKANGFDNDAIVVYGDTDSVMVKFGMTDLPSAMERGKEAAAYVTSKFNDPVKLEFEKVYWPYLLMSKKRYAGLYWTRTDKFDKIDTKGIETVRRDNCAFVRSVIDTCLQKILVEREIEGAKDFAKQMISDLLQNKMDMSFLVISKQITRPIESYTNAQPHVELAKKLEQRTGIKPQMGERVFYVITERGKDARAYEKAEDPQFAMEQGLSIDTNYYLSQQLEKPLLRLFTPVMGSGSVGELFKGAHTRVVRKPSQSAMTMKGTMGRFFSVGVNCICCHTPIRSSVQNKVQKTNIIQSPPGFAQHPQSPQSQSSDLSPSPSQAFKSQAVCDECKIQGKEGYTLMDTLDTVRRCEQEFSRVLSQCQRCQSQLHRPFECSSKDCTLFYYKNKVKIDLEDAYKCLNRFGPPYQM